MCAKTPELHRKAVDIASGFEPKQRRETSRFSRRKNENPTYFIDAFLYRVVRRAGFRPMRLIDTGISLHSGFRFAGLSGHVVRRPAGLSPDRIGNQRECGVYGRNGFGDDRRYLQFRDGGQRRAGVRLDSQQRPVFENRKLF